MAGKVVVSTLNDDAGVLATQNGMTGIAKAWVNYNGVSQTINGSFNVGSVTRNSTGNYTINFTTAMANANYSVAGTAVRNASDSNMELRMPLGGTYTTSAVQVISTKSSVIELEDSPRVTLIVCGS